MVYGDRHNGMRVYQKDGHIYKPRTCDWERLFLSKTPFRSFVDSAMKTECGFSPFGHVPLLRFYPQATGSFEAVEAVDLVNAQLVYDWRSIGALIGMLLWLGVGDLHFENILFGACTKTGLSLVAPVDIEVIFEGQISIAQSLLGPSQDTGDIYGLRAIASYVSRYKDDLIFGFESSIRFLEERRETVFFSMNLESLANSTPIRVVLRPTTDYARAIETGDVERFHLEERAQLERGDIPYFFRYLKADEILWLRDGSASVVSFDASNFFTPQRFTFDQLGIHVRNVELLVQIFKRDLEGICCAA